MATIIAVIFGSAVTGCGRPQADRAHAVERADMVLLHGKVLTVDRAAIDWVVDSYAQALAAKPTRGLRHGIIHANTPTTRANDVMSRLQRDFDAGYPEAQGTFLGGWATPTPPISDPRAPCG